MTLVDAIMKRAKVKKRSERKYSSPPPEVEEAAPEKRPKRPHKYAHIRGVVDSHPPVYPRALPARRLPEWGRRVHRLHAENIQLLTAIRKTQFDGGKVDSHWEKRPLPSRQYYEKRVQFYKRVQAENRAIYQRILATGPRVTPASHHRRAWAKSRQQIILGAQARFVLFPPVPRELIEDPSFRAPDGVRRPRVYLTLRIRNCATMGDICVELFTDVCPHTCRLFLELLAGDAGTGYGYVGTCFYRKVPGLYWSGGDVVYDNGCGCYAQRGRRVPIGAENYHFPHSMPGLLTMRVTADDEMCGVFSITFKPLTQFDLHSVVFGRVVRPCNTYSSMVGLGTALTTWPVVEIAGARLPSGRGWVTAVPNTKISSALKSIRH